MPPRRDDRREAQLYAELALFGRRLEYSCWIDKGGHRERLVALVDRVRDEAGLDMGLLLAEVDEALAEDDDEPAVVEDAVREIVRRLHVAILGALAR